MVDLERRSRANRGQRVAKVSREPFYHTSVFTAAERRRHEAIVRRSLLSNHPRIVKAAKRSLTKHYEHRPSPPLSATLFTRGSIEKGNNGRRWTMTGRNWVPI